MKYNRYDQNLSPQTKMLKPRKPLRFTGPDLTKIYLRSTETTEGYQKAATLVNNSFCEALKLVSMALKKNLKQAALLNNKEVHKDEDGKTIPLDEVLAGTSEEIINLANTGVWTLSNLFNPEAENSESFADGDDGPEYGSLMQLAVFDHFQFDKKAKNKAPGDLNQSVLVRDGEIDASLWNAALSGIGETDAFSGVSSAKSGLIVSLESLTRLVSVLDEIVGSYGSSEEDKKEHIEAWAESMDELGADCHNLFGLSLTWSMGKDIVAGAQEVAAYIEGSIPSEIEALEEGSEEREALQTLYTTWQEKMDKVTQYLSGDYNTPLPALPDGEEPEDYYTSLQYLKWTFNRLLGNDIGRKIGIKRMYKSKKREYSRKVKKYEHEVIMDLRNQAREKEMVARKRAESRAAMKKMEARRMAEKRAQNKALMKPKKK